MLGALVLGLLGIAALSARRLFADHRTFVVFFPYAVGGLRAGSPVTFRQVPIGSVRDVDLVFTGRGFADSWIMAIIDVRRGALRNPADVGPEPADDELARALVQAGLRATVRSSSLIAGQRSVDLDLHPDQKPRLAGIHTGYPEIPTAPTGMELINERVEATLKKISDVPIDEVLLQLDSTLKKVETLMDGGDVPGTLRHLRTTLDTATRTLARAEAAVGQVDALAAQGRTTLASVEDSMKGIQKSLDRVDRTLATVDRNVEGTAELRRDAALAVNEMNDLLKSLRHLVETLQQRPETLIRGRAPARKP